MCDIKRTDERGRLTEEITNRARVSGILSVQPEFSHSIYGEDFMMFCMEIPRLSGVVDILPVTAAATLVRGVKTGESISIEGQLRSYNRIIEGASRLDLRLFAHRICADDEPVFANEIELTGYVCKPTVYRTTPFGREITDILLAVNRRFNKSDYIPCIVWGRNARRAREFAVGDKLHITGRLQSREYDKKLDTGETLRRTTYELSVSSVCTSL